MAAYLSLVLEEDDPAELANALGVIARAPWHDRDCQRQRPDPRGSLQGAYALAASRALTPSAVSVVPLGSLGGPAYPRLSNPLT